MCQHGLKEAIYAKEYPSEDLERLRRARMRRGAGSWVDDIFYVPSKDFVRSWRIDYEHRWIQ